jgi:hypothetical protein
MFFLEAVWLTECVLVCGVMSVSGGVVDGGGPGSGAAECAGGTQASCGPGGA